MYLLAIDPGAQTGVAFLVDGVITHLFSGNSFKTLDEIKNHAYYEWFDALAIEDSTLISHIYTAPKLSAQAKLKVARNIGEVDYICKAIKHAWGDRPLFAISPKEKGRKLNAEEFNQLTGWTGKSNQHERDAAMVGWKLRNMNL